jgi:hypothetical protein
MKRVIIIVAIFAIAKASTAQSPLLDSAKNELYKVNKLFDSSQYIGFNLQINYKSDSANNITVETDQMQGNYVLNNRNVYYNMGSNIFVKTDSFTYNIYPEEEMMLMSKTITEENSNSFPLRNFIDSMMYYYGAEYTISMSTLPIDSFDSVRRIRFDRTTTSIQDTTGSNDSTEAMRYNYFYIDYGFGANNAYQPIKFEFSYYEEDVSNTYDSLGNVLTQIPYIATKTVAMHFSDFKVDLDFALFKDESYVFYNRLRKIFEPTGKYSNYRFSATGFDNEDDDAEAYREMEP